MKIVLDVGTRPKDEDAEDDEFMADWDRREQKCELEARNLKRAFHLETGSDDRAVLDNRILTILQIAVVRASVIDVPHIQRVSLAVSVLRAVRHGFRYTHDGSKIWTSEEGTLQQIDRAADSVALRILPAMNKSAIVKERPAFHKFFRGRSSLPTLREDLRFMAEPSGDSPVPFGPDFPRFEPHEIDGVVKAEIFSDLVELMTAQHAPREFSGSEGQRLARISNLVEFFITIAALGKCVLCSWSSGERAIIDWLACIDGDLYYDSGDWL